MNRNYYLAALTPPGTIIAAIEGYQNTLFAENNAPCAIGPTPAVPLVYFREAVDPPDPVPRFQARLVQHIPVVFRANLFISFLDASPVDPVRTIFSGPEYKSRALSGEAGLYPVFSGFFVSPWSETEKPPEYNPPKNTVSSSSFSLSLYEYRTTAPSEGVWDIFEERLLWQLPLRKPR